MNCFVYACEEPVVFVSQMGFICNTHAQMMREEHKKKLIRYCMNCSSAECVHAKDGVVDEKVTEDGKPETLGVSVSERIKSGDQVG